MMIRPAMCPTHPSNRADNCQPCEARFEREQDRVDDVDGHGANAAADAYERWLDRIGGSA